MQQFVVIQWSGIKKMEVTVEVVRSSIACVAIVSVSTNLAKRPGSVEDGRCARVGAKKGTSRIFRVFLFSLPKRNAKDCYAGQLVDCWIP